MKVLLLTMALIAGNAFAYGYKTNTTAFTITPFAADGSRVYYNCQSVENKVELMLKDLGAKNIRVRCSGGIDRWSVPTPAFVRATFDALSAQVDGNLSTALMNQDLDQRDSCHLNMSVFDSVKKYFEINTYNARRCYRPGDRTLLKVEVMKETL